MVIKVIELGETAAVKMHKADSLLFPDRVVNDLPLYGNQFIPLGIKTTMKERIRIASLFDSYCNGGSIAHINIEAPFNNFEQEQEQKKEENKKEEETLNKLGN